MTPVGGKGDSASSGLGRLSSKHTSQSHQPDEATTKPEETRRISVHFQTPKIASNARLVVMLPVKNTAPDISTRDFREPIIPLFQNSIARLRTNRLDAVFPCWGWIARDSTPSEAPAQTPENNFFTDHLRREPACPIRQISAAISRKKPKATRPSLMMLAEMMLAEYAS